MLAGRVAPDGDVIVVDPSVDRLEGLRLASAEPDITYLVGEPEVLPLPDESVDGLWLAATPDPAAAEELFRVLRPGGTVSFGGSGDSALNRGERMLTDAGFVEVAAVDTDGGASLAARKP